jgi:hypothetical protein
MPRPAFYNDNEYRAYPFIYKPTSTLLPEAAVVDAGVVMRLDAQYDETQHSVWLHKIERAGVAFIFTLKSDAFDTDGPTLSFTRALNSAEWEAEYVDSDSLDVCAEVTNDPDPAWTGFLVTGRLDELDAVMTASGSNTLTFAPSDYPLEPARIQNLANGYVRSLNVGNYRRVYVPNCCSDDVTNIPIVVTSIEDRDAILNPVDAQLVATTDDSRYWRYDAANDEWTDISIVVNARCIRGDIRLIPGYNCDITQITRLNEISISAAIGAGDQDTAELCSNGGELPLYDGELQPLLENDLTRSKFFSGGPACNDLIFTINGVGGSAITLAGGVGINIKTDTNPPRITVERNTALSYGNCSSNQS